MQLTYDAIKGSYSVNKRKYFNGVPISNIDLEKALNFAFKMCFGDGHHRARRSGGQHTRRNGEKFCNTFQGKLAELVLYNLLISNKINCDNPDFSVLGKGLWDDSDLVANGKKLNIKSASHFSNLLLLETKDWNDLGEYIPNINSNATTVYDYFILVRIKPDIKKLFKSKRYFYSDSIEKIKIKTLILEKNGTTISQGFVQMTR